MIRAASASPPRTGALTSLSAALGYALEGVGYTANAVIPRPPLFRCF